MNATNTPDAPSTDVATNPSASAVNPGDPSLTTDRISTDRRSVDRSSTDSSTAETYRDVERRELLVTLAHHRRFLWATVQGITEEQARTRTTVSELTLASLLKHVCLMEAQWIDFVVRGTSAIPDFDPESFTEERPDFLVAEDDTVESLLADHTAVAAQTEAAIAGVADLSSSHPLPSAPWFEPGASWSARRVLLHLIAETAQHAGHADIIRESIDGAKTMG